MAERFLIVRLSALGDVVCGLPVAVALREAYPKSEILWAVDPRFAGIPLCSTAISQVVLARKPSDIEPFGEFDAAIDLQGLLKSAAIVRRAKARLKVGYHWQREGSALFTRRVLPDPSSVHVVDQYVDVARALGATMNRARFGIKPLAEDLPHVAVAARAVGLHLAAAARHGHYVSRADGALARETCGSRALYANMPSMDERQAQFLDRFRSNLRRLRGSRTQKQVASGAGLARVAVSHYESGRHMPSMQVLFLLAESLGVDPVELIAEPPTAPACNAG